MLQKPTIPHSIDYLRNGDEIYRKSFAIVREQANLSHLSADLAQVAVRLIHACGMTDIVQDLSASPDAVQVGREALIKPIERIRATCWPPNRRLTWCCTESG